MQLKAIEGKFHLYPVVEWGDGVTKLHNMHLNKHTFSNLPLHV